MAKKPAAKAAQIPAAAPPRNHPDWLTGGGGWGAVEEMSEEDKSEAVSEDLLRQFEDAKLVHDVFVSSPRGPELLERLRDRLVNTPPTKVHGVVGFDLLDFPIEPEQWLWMRTGMNLVFHFIEAEIFKAERGPPTVQSGGE